MRCSSQFLINGIMKEEIENINQNDEVPPLPPH